MNNNFNDDYNNDYGGYDNYSDDYNDNFDTGYSDNSYENSFEDSDSIVVGKINTSKLFSNIFHKVNQDYYGEEHVNLGNFRFQLFTLPFYSFYMLYYKTYGLFITTGLVLGILEYVVGKFAGFLGGLFTLAVMAVMSIATTELIRYARVKKSIKLESKGLSDSEIEAKLRPSWVPVIVYIAIFGVLIVLGMILTAILAGIAAAAFLM